MRLTEAILCLDCQWVYSSKDHRYCPVCLNKHGMSLSRVLNRKEEQVMENVVPMKKRRAAR